MDIQVHFLPTSCLHFLALVSLVSVLSLSLTLTCSSGCSFPPKCPRLSWIPKQITIYLLHSHLAPSTSIKFSSHSDCPELTSPPLILAFLSFVFQLNPHVWVFLGETHIHEHTYFVISLILYVFCTSCGTQSRVGTQ